MSCLFLFLCQFTKENMPGTHTHFRINVLGITSHSHSKSLKKLNKTLMNPHPEKFRFFRSPRNRCWLSREAHVCSHIFASSQYFSKWVEKLESPRRRLCNAYRSIPQLLREIFFTSHEKKFTLNYETQFNKQQQRGTPHQCYMDCNWMEEVMFEAAVSERQ